MEEVLKTTLLEYDKSTFIVELVKHNLGVNYIRIKQVIDGKSEYNVIRINPSIISDFISILEIYQKETKTFNAKSNRSYFSEDNQKLVVSRYLKGISIKDLALQFDCSKQIIEQILFNKNIEIIDEKPLKEKRKFNFRRRK